MTLFEEMSGDPVSEALDEMISPALRFVVYGQPRPGGSKKAFVNPKTGKAVIVDDSGAAGKSWRQEVATAGRVAVGPDAPLLLGALAVEFTFYRPRPKGHYGSGANAWVLKASAPPAPITRPDALKLARAVEDALTGILWKDDAQIVQETLRKVWGEPERCEITVRAL